MAKAKKEKEIVVLPESKRLDDIIKTYEAGESTSPINDLFSNLIEKPAPGLLVVHAGALEKRVHEARVRAWLKNNKYADPKNAPKPRRADGTYLRDIIAFSLIPGIKSWQYLTTLTNAYNTRSVVAGLAAVEYAKNGKVPSNAWFEKTVKAQFTKGDDDDAIARKASVYIQRIVDACGKWKMHHPKTGASYLTAILNSAKAAKIEALGIESAAKQDASAARRAAKKAGK